MLLEVVTVATIPSFKWSLDNSVTLRLGLSAAASLEHLQHSETTTESAECPAWSSGHARSTAGVGT